MNKASRLLAAIVVACAVLGIVLIPGDEKPRPAPTPPTAKVDGPDADRKADDKITLAPGARAMAKDPPPDVDTDGTNELRDETPPGSPIAAPGLDAADAPPGSEARDAFEDSQEAAKRTTTGSDEPLPAGPLAAQSFPGCRTAFFNANTSSRGGARPAVIFLHFWGNKGRAGRGDLDGLTLFGSNPRARVSWHFGMDREGFCDFNVPLELKAWTEANANPFGIGIEMEGDGTFPDYAGAGWAKLSATVRRVAKLYGIPLQLAIVRDCRLVRAGIGTHWPLGSCGGGHTDIKPYELAPIIARLRADAAREDAPPVAKVLYRWCHHIARHRAIERAGTTTRKQRAHQRIHLGDVARRGYTCGVSGPVRIKAAT